MTSAPFFNRGVTLRTTNISVDVPTQFIIKGGELDFLRRNIGSHMIDENTIAFDASFDFVMEPLRELVTTGQYEGMLFDDLYHFCDRFGIRNNSYLYPNDFYLIKVHEDWIRDYFYEEESKNTDIRDDLYNLMKIGDEELNHIRNATVRFEGDLLFLHHTKSVIAGADKFYPEVFDLKYMEDHIPPIMKEICAISPNIVIAGGAIFKLLVPRDYSASQNFMMYARAYDQKDTLTGDVDIFIYGVTDEEMFQLVRSIVRIIRNHLQDEEIAYMYRDHHTITIKGLSIGVIQIILRGYVTMAEILTGFDVDSCAIGYNSSGLYATPRCYYSLINRINFFDFDRMSPSYEYRLAKYGKRGISLFVPFFRFKYVDTSFTVNSMRNIFVLSNPFKHPVDETLNLIPDRNYGHDVMKNRNGLSRLIISHISNVVAKESDYSSENVGKLKTIDTIFDFDVYGENEYSNPEYTDRLEQYYHNREYEKWMFPILVYRLDVDVIGIRASNETIEENIEDLLSIPDDVYSIVTFSIPQKPEIIRLRPGDQLTSSFHRQVLSDKRVFYEEIYDKDFLPHWIRNPLHLTVTGTPEASNSPQRTYSPRVKLTA